METENDLLQQKRAILIDAAAKHLERITRHIRVWTQRQIKKGSLVLPVGEETEDFVTRIFSEIFLDITSPDNVARFDTNKDPLGWYFGWCQNAIRSNVRDQARLHNQQDNPKYATQKSTGAYVRDDSPDETIDSVLSRLSANRNIEREREKIEIEFLDGFETLAEAILTKNSLGLPIELQLKELLSKGPAKHSEILMMKYDDGLTVAEIADKLNISEEAVKKRLERAREYFKNLAYQKDISTK